MKYEQPPVPSPEEVAKIEKDRVLSDAEFLKGGAEYKFDEKGEKRLEVTEGQIEEAKIEKRVADLGSYIKLHKEITLPVGEILDEEFKKELLNKKGLFFFDFGIHCEMSDEFQFQYVDKDGNIASIKIKPSEIASYSGIDEKLQSELKRGEEKRNEGKIINERENIVKVLKKELEKNGFLDYMKQVWDYKKSVRQEIEHMTEEYKKKIEKEIAKKKREEFDF